MHKFNFNTKKKYEYQKKKVWNSIPLKNTVSRKKSVAIKRKGVKIIFPFTNNCGGSEHDGVSASSNLSLWETPRVGLLRSHRSPPSHSGAHLPLIQPHQPSPATPTPTPTPTHWLDSYSMYVIPIFTPLFHHNFTLHLLLFFLLMLFHFISSQV